MSTKKILNFDEIKFNYFDTEINNIEKPIIFKWISTTGNPFVEDLLSIKKDHTNVNDYFINISDDTAIKNKIIDKFYDYKSGKYIEATPTSGGGVELHDSDASSQYTVTDGLGTSSEKTSELESAFFSVKEYTNRYTEKNADTEFILKKLVFKDDSGSLENITESNNIDFYHCDKINEYIYIDDMSIRVNNELFNKINNICYLYQIYKKYYDSINNQDYSFTLNAGTINLYNYFKKTDKNISIQTSSTSDYDFNFKDKLQVDSDNILLNCHIDFLNDLIETKKDDPENLKKRIFLYYNIIKILFQVYITDLFYKFNVFIKSKLDTYTSYNTGENIYDTDETTKIFNSDSKRSDELKTEIITHINKHFDDYFIQKCKNELLIKNKEKNLFIYGIKSLDIQPIFTKKSSCIFETSSDDILKYVENNIIDKDKFVIIDTDTKNIHNLNNDITIKQSNDKYEIDLTGHSDICSLNSIKVISKNSYAEKLKYDNLNLELTDLNKKYFEKSDVLDDKQSKNISLNDNYKYINLFYYLTFIIIIFIVGSLLNQSDINKIILYLIITIIIYSLFNVYTETREYFDTEGDIADGINTEIILYVNSLFLIADSKIELYYLYKKLSENTEKELSLKILQDKYIDHNIINEEENINSSWINYYRKIMFIHTLFLMVLVIIIFHLLNSIFSGVTYILLLISIIAFMVILFLYFSKINSIVRTNSKHKYWSNMKI